MNWIKIKEIREIYKGEMNVGKKIKLLILISLSAYLIFFFNLDSVTAFKSDRMLKYFPLGATKMIVAKGPEGTFDYIRTHTLSVVELNKDGYRFWGYYQGYDGKNINHDMGLVYSNDMENWVKEEKNPIIRNLRWGTVVVADGIVNMFGTRNYGEDSNIVRLTSENGKDFIEQETVVKPIKNHRNQNPFIFYDEKNEMYRLYYFHLDGEKNIIEEKHSADIAGLANSTANIVLQDNKDILAAPSILYRSGRYWLTAETLHLVDGVKTWKTIAFVSDDPVKGFVPVANHEILVDQDACFFPYIFDNKLYGVYSHEYKDGTWELFRRIHEFKNQNKIRLDTIKVDMAHGNSKYLKATLTLPDGSEKDVTSAATWATSDNSTVKVNDGKVNALKKGIAIITASYGGSSTTTVVNSD